VNAVYRIASLKAFLFNSLGSKFDHVGRIAELQ
jgi:hypothetical protein